MFSSNTSPKLLTTLLAAITVSVAGCGDKSEAKATATQVAAKVNGAEISVHQINTLLTKASGVTNENAPRARKEILDRLVDQQLAVEQAVAKKLDRNPDILLNIEAARREILARAYLEQVATASPKPTDEEVKRYYDEHPELFSQRRVYALQELAIGKNVGSLDGLQELVTSGKSLEEIANWLKSKNIPARGSAGTRAAEQLPIELLPKLAEMKNGQTALIDSPQLMYVMRIMSSQVAPVDEATAKAKIQQFLHNQRSSKLVADEMKRLKETAKIEFLGDFAKEAGTSTPQPAAQTAAATAQAAAPAPAASAIEKGVAGLK